MSSLWSASVLCFSSVRRAAARRHQGLDVAMLFYRTEWESTWIAFRDRANLKKIELPDRVTSVDFMAFADPSRTND